MNRPIGVLDSGVGGLTIWREIVKELPNESTIYIADSKNCPYGIKTAKEIYNLAKRLVAFLVTQDVKLIVLACNTITVSCLLKLREEFKDVPIIGTVPVIKTASELTKNKKIGILSTVRTAKSTYQKNLIEQFANGNKVLNLGTDKLVPLIEKGDHVKMIQIILQQELKPFIDAKVDVLALGCTHFPLIKNEIQGILGSKVRVLDSGAAIARQVARVLEKENMRSKTKPNHNFYTTGNKTQLTKILATMGYKRSLKTLLKSEAFKLRL